MQNIGDRIRIPGALLCSDRISTGHERRIVGDNNKDGKPGMPMEMPAVKFTQCLTSKDLVPQSNDPDRHDC